MKKFFKIFVSAGLLLTAILAVTSCSGNWEPPYEDLNKNGYTVSVKFDANGGVFAGTNDVYIVDVFNAADVTDGKGAYLLSPDDPLRAEGAFEISRNGYFLAGWYTEREARVNDKGEALDDYGVPVSESGRPQGYSYSGKWDFETSTLRVDNASSLNSASPVCTLYAAWIPYFNYEFYAENENGDFELIGSEASINLEIPQWSEKTGKLDSRSFPEREGYTFDTVYLDERMENRLTENISGADLYVDYTTGTTATEKVCVYTTWLEGNWFKVYNAEQMYSNSRLDGNYILCGNLDFSESVWSPTLTKGKFTGKIYGNGFTISNVTVVQGDNSQLFGGLFGSIDSGAVFDNVKFENVSYEISAGSRMQGATFGLFAGTIASDAVFTDVSVQGELLIGSNCYPQNSYVIGLLCSSGDFTGIDSANITCTVAEGTENITVTTEENGTVAIVFN